MRALALVLATSCAVLAAACTQQAPGGPLVPGGGGAGAGGSGPGSGAGAGPTSGAGAGSTTSSGGGTDPQAFFDANVKPILAQACASCHADNPNDATGGPDFLGLTEADYYESLLAESRFVNSAPETSYLLTKGLHTGPAFSATQYDVVLEWLELEAAAISNGGGGVFEGPTGEELIQQFSDCMTLDDWVATGMQTVATQPTLNGIPCSSCHQSGTGGNYMTNPNTQASIEEGFYKMQPRPFVERLVTYEVVTSENGNQHAELVQSYGWAEKGNGGSDHPKYVFTEQQPKVDEWFSITMANCFPGQ